MNQIRSQFKTDIFQYSITRILPIFSLVVNLIFIIGYFFIVPYFGFSIVDGFVNVSCYENPDGLLVGDEVLSINGNDFQGYLDNIKIKFTDVFNTGSINEYQIIRNGESHVVSLPEMGWNACGFKIRLTQPWLNGVIFWLAGFIYFITIKPGDKPSLLLGSSFLLSSMWLIAGGSLSSFHYLFSAEVLRFVGWLTLPVLFHFHAIFPNKLNISPGTIFSIYILTFSIGVIEIFGILDVGFFYYGLYFGIPIIAVLLLLQIWKGKEFRSISLLLLISLVFAAAPSFVTAILRNFSTSGVFHANWATLFSMPLFPIGYISAINIKSPDKLRFDSNKFITPYLFVIIVASLTVTFYFLANNAFHIPAFSTILILSIMVTVLSILAYPRFREFIDENLLGIPWSLEQVVSKYSETLSTCDNTERLTDILRMNVLPSFRVKETIIYTKDNDGFHEILVYGLDQSDLLPGDQLESLYQELHRSPYLDYQLDQAKWYYLIVPLVAQNEMVGLWFIGGKESALTYSTEEIQFIRAIANQTAVALANISRAKVIANLYRFNINQQEEQNKRIARELHDEVLNELVVISMELDSFEDIDKTQGRFQKLSDNLRGMISGLRPSMLDYGLHAGLEELKGDLESRSKSDIIINLAIDASDHRPPLNIEENIFRIIQQAIENVYRHSNASQLDITGTIHDQYVEISITDNGIGFDFDENLDLTDLIQSGSFGLAGMFERSSLIDAILQINSEPGVGTRINIKWEAA